MLIDKLSIVFVIIITSVFATYSYISVCDCVPEYSIGNDWTWGEDPDILKGGKLDPGHIANPPVKSNKKILDEDSLNKLLEEKPVKQFGYDYGKMQIKIIFTDRSFVIMQYTDQKIFLVSVENLKNTVPRVDKLD